jgi:hypothetical protein
LIQVVEEAGFHGIKAIIARGVGEVQLSDIARSLIAEHQALVARERRRYTVSQAARTVIAALSGAVLNLG